MPVDPTRAAQAGGSARATMRVIPTLLAAVVVLSCAPSAVAALKFAPPATFPVDYGTYSIAADDFNGDGDPDLAVANHGPNAVSVLLGAAGGDFGAPTTFPVAPPPGR